MGCAERHDRGVGRRAADDERRRGRRTTLPSPLLLENLLIFISVAVLGFTYRKFQFSHISYVLILIFLSFHTIGAHYTYAKVPAGFWLQHWLHLSRNHYDRVIHFSFGLLLLY